MRQKLIAALLAFGCLCGFTSAASAQSAETNWPTRPITMVVAYPPGAITDTVGRRVAERLSQTLNVDARRRMTMRIGRLIGRTVLLAASALILASGAEAQQIRGTSGASDSVMTPNLFGLPAPAPPFSGVIMPNAADSQTAWPAQGRLRVGGAR